MRRTPMPAPVEECRMCRDHPSGLCRGHIIDSIDNSEQLLNVVLGWLNTRCSTHEERVKARRVIMRNLMHPEANAQPEYGVQFLEATAEQKRRAAPYIESPLCICGKRRSGHDAMTGEAPGCDGFYPVPS